MADILNFKPRAAQASATDDALDVTRPCPFCGEREKLFLGEEENRIAVDADGKPEIKIIPIIFCEVCDAMAPVETWNGRAHPPGAA